MAVKIKADATEKQVSKLAHLGSRRHHLVVTIGVFPPSTSLAISMAPECFLSFGLKRSGHDVLGETSLAGFVQCSRCSFGYAQRLELREPRPRQVHPRGAETLSHGSKPDTGTSRNLVSWTATPEVVVHHSLVTGVLGHSLRPRSAYRATYLLCVITLPVLTLRKKAPLLLFLTQLKI